MSINRGMSKKDVHIYYSAIKRTRIVSFAVMWMNPEIVIQNEVNGLLIPVKDQKAMEEGINRLIENPDFAEGLGKEAKKICEQLNGPAIIEQWRKYIEKTIEEE